MVCYGIFWSGQLLNYSYKTLKRQLLVMNESWPVALFEEYRIYSISRPERFWSLKMGAYSRWALIKFSTFSASMVCLFCNKTINGYNKTRRGKVSVKYSEENSAFSGKFLISTFSVLGGWEGERRWTLIWVSVVYISQWLCCFDWTLTRGMWILELS